MFLSNRKDHPHRKRIYKQEFQKVRMLPMDPPAHKVRMDHMDHRDHMVHKGLILVDNMDYNHSHRTIHNNQYHDICMVQLD